MAIDDLRRRPTYLVRRIRQISLALFAVNADGLDVTPQQYTVLRALEESPSVEQTRLCEIIQLDRSTTASLLSRLESKGWVRRRPSRRHRRINDVFITPRGRAFRKRLEPIINRTNDELLEPLSRPQREPFLALLRAVVAGHQSRTEVAEQVRPGRSRLSCEIARS